MGKVAVELEQALARRAVNGEVRPAPWGRVLAEGEGWTVEDVVCTAGPHDRPYEERHATVGIAVVVAGSFQYRTANGREMMTPGSLMLGNAGQCYECGHEHDVGDRCVAFHYEPEYFARLAADAGVPRDGRTFRVPRLPPLRAMSPLVAGASAALEGAAAIAWEELAVRLAVRTLRLAADRSRDAGQIPVGAEARVTRAVRRIEQDPGGAPGVGRLAEEAGLSPYYFLRTFVRITGVTPHQYVLRARLREAATRLAVESVRVIDIAYESGFGDVSNFNRAFRAEFGMTPRTYRQRAWGPRTS